MFGAQRRVEARIGQLIGHALVGRPVNGNSPSLVNLSSPDRQRFRLLARAFDLALAEEDWRQPRDRRSDQFPSLGTEIKSSDRQRIP
jgi:hypothetical protein